VIAEGSLSGATVAADEAAPGVGADNKKATSTRFSLCRNSSVRLSYSKLNHRDA
jgi:hypothetical protein